MPRLITSPTSIPVPGGKIINEHVGRVNSGTEAVSVAHMVAPPGWEEPAQTPDFDEVTLVLKGEVVVEHEGGPTTVAAGQSIITSAGESALLLRAGGRRVRRGLPSRLLARARQP
jgi:quercetin dioxygenase-like cupin family protein